MYCKGFSPQVTTHLLPHFFYSWKRFYLHKNKNKNLNLLVIPDRNQLVPLPSEDRQQAVCSAKAQPSSHCYMAAGLLKSAASGTCSSHFLLFSLSLMEPKFSVLIAQAAQFVLPTIVWEVSCQETSQTAELLQLL